MSQSAKLEDMLSYTPEEYYTEEDLALIRSTFKDNPRLLNVLRKTLLPTITDPNLPLEEFQKDAMIAGKNWGQVPESERGAMVVARQEAISFVVGGLIQLKTIANTKEESEQEKKLRKEKDSTK